MGRAPRVHFAEAVYHVVVRGNNRAPILASAEMKEQYLSILAEAFGKYSVKTLALALMSNHAHLLVQVGDFPLGQALHRIQFRFARRQNWLSGGTGHVFEKRYWAALCTTDAYLLNVLRYIHRNPIEARLAVTMDVYPWTSHAAYLGSGDPLISTELCLSLFGRGREAVDAYRAFMEARAPAKWPHDVPPPIDEPVMLAVGPQAPLIRSVPIGLTTLLDRYADSTGVTRIELAGASRARRLAALRVQFAREAMNAGFSIADTARALRRAKSVVFRYTNKGTQ